MGHFVRAGLMIVLMLAGPASAEMVLNRSGGSDPSSLDPQKATGNTAAPILEHDLT